MTQIQEQAQYQDIVDDIVVKKDEVYFNIQDKTKRVCHLKDVPEITNSNYNLSRRAEEQLTDLKATVTKATVETEDGTYWRLVQKNGAYVVPIGDCDICTDIVVDTDYSIKPYEVEMYNLAAKTLDGNEIREETVDESTVTETFADHRNADEFNNWYSVDFLANITTFFIAISGLYIFNSSSIFTILSIIVLFITTVAIIDYLRDIVKSVGNKNVKYEYKKIS